MKFTELIFTSLMENENDTDQLNNYCRILQYVLKDSEMNSQFETMVVKYLHKHSYIYNIRFYVILGELMNTQATVLNFVSSTAFPLILKLYTTIVQQFEINLQFTQAIQIDEYVNEPNSEDSDHSVITMTSSLSLDEDYQMLGKQNDETMSYRNLMSDIG